MEAEGYKALIETRLSDQHLRVTVAMLRALASEFGNMDELCQELEKNKDNVVSNFDRILEELRKDA